MAMTRYSGGSHTHTTNSTGDDADVPGDLDAEPGILIDSAATVTITGGTIQGGNGDGGDGPSSALLLLESSLAVSGGTFTGGTTGTCVGGLGALVLLPTSLSITGGDFTGGAAVGDSNGSTAFSASLMGVGGTIADGSFTPGAPAGTGVAGCSLGYYGTGSSDLRIEGGLFNGDIAIRIETGSSFTVIGIFSVQTTSHITGTLDNGDAIDCDIVNLGGTIGFSGPQPVNGIRYWA